MALCHCLATKSKILAILMCFLAFLLLGCPATVPLAEYEKVKTELATTKAEYEKVKTELATTKRLLSEARIENTELKKRIERCLIYIEISSMIQDPYRVELDLPPKHGYRAGEEERWMRAVSKKIAASKDPYLEKKWRLFLETDPEERIWVMIDMGEYILEQLMKIMK